MSKLPRGRPRRIDFLYCHPNEFPFALLHFTGSGTFNQVLRAHATKKGCSLSEHGIKYLDGKQNTHSFREEKDIFEFLEIDWLHPKDRENPPKLT